MRSLPVQLGMLMAALLLVSAPAFAQSLTTGDISGKVIDPSGAAIPNASVSLKGVNTGATQATTSNQSGQYRFTLLKPGRYTVGANETSFQPSETTVDVNVGQVVTADLKLEVGRSTTTVEVSAGGALVNTEPANITSFTQAQMELLPTAGGDITNIAFTAPGVVVDVTGGYGNFTVNDLPNYLKPVYDQRRKRYGPVLQYQQYGSD